MYRVQFSVKDGINDGTYIVAETPEREVAVKALKEGIKRAKKVVAAFETFEEYYGGLTEDQKYNYEYEKNKMNNLVMVNLNPPKKQPKKK